MRVSPKLTNIIFLYMLRNNIFNHNIFKNVILENTT